ncbi:MAG: GTP cyclohydrolase I FolE [Candidatus Latescibacteria bacterium]|nr:GTP cyclohydrolase I FolE [Candidatus Latescibacterota bacterium]NIM66377.1 GTP cyclohydrolase I FolE [Candidatus Latescibacterota bacterium]NIO02856.1 GTP cyclohydrolase I FolE [Candidatus Latescibacterota bacterium]NIO29991.1 GTP cyclohydrolase I FolE [Candidatus Latescibacterota bacterium]NIO57606.1 GTP cyclohydrolase I FolE [Candidatus Latescibacterota bacterium]
MDDVESKEDKTAALVREMLAELGENPNREGLLETPGRVSRAFKYFTRGYQMSVEDVIANAVFKEHQEEMVVLRDVDFYSLCEHHMVPFFGKCHIAYLPKEHIIGLSKLARIVEVYARRLQVQERMTREIAYAINDHLDPHGVAVVIEAQHLCMMMRGVEKQNSVATTSTMLGTFKENEASRLEFLSFIKRSGGSI